MDKQTHTGYRRNGQSLQHRREVLKYFDELKNDGWKVIDLQNKSPDGIAVKDNIIVAVEVITLSKSQKGYKGFKKREYFMFDDVLIKLVKRQPILCNNQGWRID